MVGTCWACSICPVLWAVLGTGVLKPVGLTPLGQAFVRALIVLRAGPLLVPVLLLAGAGSKPKGER